MTDPRDTRRLAKNWREYVDDIAKSVLVFRWAWREFVTSESRRVMRRAFVPMCMTVLLSMFLPLLMKAIADRLQSHAAPLVIVACLGAMLLNKWVQRIDEHYLDNFRTRAMSIDHGRLMERTSELFFGKSLGQHLRDNGLLNIANVEKGCNRVIEVEHLFGFDGVPLLLELTVTYVFVWVLSPVAGMALTLLFVSYMAFAVVMNQRMLYEASPLEAEMRRLNRHRLERWENIERVKTSGKEAEEVSEMSARYDRTEAKLLDLHRRVSRIGTVRGLCNVTIEVALTAYASWLVWHGTWQLGTLFAFLPWVNNICRNLWKIGSIESRVNRALPPVQALMDALTIPPDVRDAPAAVALREHEPVRVEFRDVSHSYGEQGGKHVLTGVSLSVEPGKKVAVMGPSGAGKTTIARLVQCYMYPERGCVLVNGHDLRVVQQASWKRLFGVISQQQQTFDGTVRYNLLYALPPEERGLVTDKEMWRVINALHLNDGGRLVDGLDTVVGRNGIQLSGGENQRLGIASAIIKKPRFLIIDEATSSLDSSTEKAVQEALVSLLPEGTSVLVITHRLSTVRDWCDEFVVLCPAATLLHGQSQIEAIAPSFEVLHERSPTFCRLAADQGVKMRKVERAALAAGE